MSRSVTVLTKKQVALYDRYQAAASKAEAAADAGRRAKLDYWWQLWLIKRDDLWHSVTEPREDGSYVFEDWLGAWLVEPWAESRATYFSVMRSIETWIILGAGTADIKLLLSQRSMATSEDLQAWMEGPKDHRTLKPIVAERLALGGETAIEALRRIAELSKGEQRKEVERYTDKDYIWALAQTLAIRQPLSWATFTVRHEHTVAGAQGEYQVDVIIRKVTDDYGKPVPESRQLKQISWKILDWALSNFGLSK